MSLMSERILRSIKNAGLSYGELHERTGIPKSALQRYATGETEKIPLDRVEAIAKATEVSAAYLMGWADRATENTLPPKSENTIPPGFEPLPEGAESYKPKGYMPVLGCVRAGMPLYADENIEEYIACDYEDENEYFALKIKGDSMNAAGINEGDYVVVRKQEIVENGEIAIVIVNGDDATIKRFSRQGNTVVLTPQSYNAEHKPQIYDLSEIPVRVIGKVVEARRKF